MEFLQSCHTYHYLHSVTVCAGRERAARRSINAMMWIVTFAELRALKNRKAVRESGFGLNPMELNDLYGLHFSLKMQWGY